MISSGSNKYVTKEGSKGVMMQFYLFCSYIQTEELLKFNCLSRGIMKHNKTKTMNLLVS